MGTRVGCVPVDREVALSKRFMGPNEAFVGGEGMRAFDAQSPVSASQRAWGRQRFACVRFAVSAGDIPPSVANRQVTRWRPLMSKVLLEQPGCLGTDDSSRTPLPNAFFIEPGAASPGPRCGQKVRLGRNSPHLTNRKRRWKASRRHNDRNITRAALGSDTSNSSTGRPAPPVGRVPH